MTQTQIGELLGYVLAAMTGGVAAALGAWQWVEHRRRSPDIPAWDRRHFRSQNLRRCTGSLLMLLLAIGLALGNALEPNVGKKVNPTFLQVWIVVGVLLITLLGLALSDWLANRAYAQRVRRELERERIALMQTELARRSGRVVKRRFPYEELFSDSPN